MQAKRLAPLEPDDEAVHALRLHREIRRAHAQRPVPGVAQHVVKLRVPRQRVVVQLRVLVHQRAGLGVVHDHDAVVVHRGDASAVPGEIQALDAARVLHDSHRERLVDEDLDDRAVLQTDERTLAARRPAGDLDVPHRRVEHPLALEAPVEIQELQFLLLAQDQPVGRRHQQAALQRAPQRGGHDVLHVMRVPDRPVVQQPVQHHAVGELHGELVFVDGDLLDERAALDAHAPLGDEVLHDDVRHRVAVRVAVVVQPVHRPEGQRVHADAPVLAPHRHGVRARPLPRAPHPRLFFADDGEVDAGDGGQPRLAVRAAHHHAVALPEEAHVARVVPQAFALARARAVQVVERERAIPATHRQDVGLRAARLGAPSHRPARPAGFDLHLLAPGLVPHADAPIELPEREELAVVRPRHAQDLSRDPVLRHGLLLGRPQPEVPRGGGRELRASRTVRQALDGLTVAVPQHALCFVSPDDHSLIRRAGREVLAVPSVGNPVHRVFVAPQRVQQVTVGGVVHEHSAADSGDELSAIGTVRQGIAHAPHAVALGRRVRPRHRRAHRGASSARLRATPSRACASDLPRGQRGFSDLATES